MNLRLGSDYVLVNNVEPRDLASRARKFMLTVIDF